MMHNREVDFGVLKVYFPQISLTIKRHLLANNICDELRKFYFRYNEHRLVSFIPKLFQHVEQFEFGAISVNIHFLDFRKGNCS